MNIYINVEVSVRELDSKILLAILAAARGHRVIVSDSESIIKGILQGVLKPGIFHTKSLTPADHKINLHKMLREKGFKITSNDEEAGVELDSFEWFGKNRFSDQMINQAAAVFTWGPEDTKFLKNLYPKHSSKIHMTGSPRVDLWKPFFSNYWSMPKGAPLKPFLLVSSNMSQSNGKGFFERYKLKKKLGYYQRGTEVLERDYSQVAESFLKTYSFIKALRLISKKKLGYDIVLRPHPAENIEIWKTYLEDMTNIHIIREDSISAWVNNAFAVMQNGCTTGVEATINKTPLINYKDFQSISYWTKPYNLGFNVDNPDDLLIKVNSLFKNLESEGQKKVNENLPGIINDKIYLDNNELAAEKIVGLWETLNDNSISKPFNLEKFKLLLKFIKFRKMIGKVRKNLLIGNSKILVDDEKFPSLKKNNIQRNVKKFQEILGIEKIKYEVLSDRTILIEKQ
jgi:surface carbohydrate biosynthesis protein